MQTRGYLWWREDYYSPCSKHVDDQVDCDICAAGIWVNHWRVTLGQWLFAISPALWRRISNSVVLGDSVIVHASDCAVNNGPALPLGPCDCQ